MGRYNQHPWLCWHSPWCSLWVWLSISSDEEGGQLLGTSQPEPPAARGCSGLRSPTRGNAGGQYWSRRLTAQGGRADPTKQQGTKAFSFQLPCTPLLEELPPGLPSPGPSHPSCPQAASPPRQSRIQACEGSWRRAQVLPWR